MDMVSSTSRVRINSIICFFHPHFPVFPFLLAKKIYLEFSTKTSVLRFLASKKWIKNDLSVCILLSVKDPRLVQKLFYQRCSNLYKMCILGHKKRIRNFEKFIKVYPNKSKFKDLFLKNQAVPF